MLKKKLFRDLWHYKGQFFTIFLMVFIGMLAFSGIHGYVTKEIKATTKTAV